MTDLTRNVYIGIDTGGSSGAFAILQRASFVRTRVSLHPMPKTEEELAKLINVFHFNFRQLEAHWCIESNSAFHRGGPGSIYQNSARSSVSLASNAAFIRGVIKGLRYPLETVGPKVWQKWLQAQPGAIPVPEPPPKPAMKMPRKKDFKNTNDPEGLFREQFNEFCRLTDEYRPFLAAWSKEKKKIFADNALMLSGDYHLTTPKAFRSGNIVMSWGYGDALAIALWLRSTVEQENDEK